MSYCRYFWHYFEKCKVNFHFIILNNFIRYNTWRIGQAWIKYVNPAYFRRPFTSLLYTYVFPTKITTITAAASDRAFKLIVSASQTKVPVSSGRSQKIPCHFVKYKTKSFLLREAAETLTGHAKTSFFLNRVQSIKTCIALKIILQHIATILNGKWGQTYIKKEDCCKKFAEFVPPVRWGQFLQILKSRSAEKLGVRGQRAI